MAVMEPVQVKAMDEEELTDEKVEQLLTQAESRLQTQALELRQDDNSVSYMPRRSKLELEPSMKPYVDTAGGIAHADDQRLLDDHNRQSANARRKIEDPIVLKKNALKERKATAGPDWFNLPRTNLTPQLKRDFQLIQMRSVLDSKRFYKKENTKAKPPEFSQVGTVVEGPTEFYSARIPNKERKRTLAEEVITGENSNGKLRKKYLEVQAAKTSGKKADYKARMVKRYGKKFKG